MKATEKEALSNLFNLDGYFAEEFASDEDELQKMRCNIDNDFPLFTNTRVGKLIEENKVSHDDWTKMELEMDAKIDTINQLAADLEKEKQRLQRILDIVLTQGGQEALCEYPHEEIIRRKISLDLPLTQEEKMAVLSVI